VGIAVRVDVPTSPGGRYRLNSRVAAAYIEQEMLFADSAPRYLISLFLEDHPGTLLKILDVLVHGIDVPSETKPCVSESKTVRVSFSVDGSLSSSIGGAFVCAFVVHPEPEFIMSTGDSGRRVAEALERALNKRLSVEPDRSTNRPEMPPQIKVFDFQPLTQQLFAGRRFSEYRFGVSARNRDHPSRALGVLLERFSRVLGSYKVPIAYLYFPDYFNESDTSDLAWLRIGVGAPRGLSTLSK